MPPTPPAQAQRPTLGVVLKGYPRLSETFIAQEIRNLERAGFSITLFSLRRPTDTKRHAVHADIQAAINYLPEYLYQQPRRVYRSWHIARRLPGYRAARKQWLADLKRQPSANRIRRFGQALVLAAERPPSLQRLYAHFLHTPASVTAYASLLLGIPWACSAHAKDIWTTPTWEIKQKLTACAWLTTCTRHNAEYLARLTPAPHKVNLNYHGIDQQRFGQYSPAYSARDGRHAAQPVNLLSVGRAVAKKGYADLLYALAKLPVELHWQFHHIGSGPLLPRLKKQGKRLRLHHRIFWHGAAVQAEVLAAYRRADIFVLNSQVDQHGDRDGLPNVLLEAQSQGLPIIATDVAGIPELLEHAHNGLLVAANDTAALSQALLSLVQQPTRRAQLGRQGQAKVEQAFDMQHNFTKLQNLLEQL